METKANYVLIGAFTLAGLLGILGFFLWFAQVQLDRQFSYYEVKFTSVSGLATASDVRFAGLPVGQVVDVRLSPDGDGTVRVRLEIGTDVPVRTSSVATIESQGVTGVSFVGISPGEATDPLLRATSLLDIPQIEAGRSMLQSLTEDAPQLVEQALRVMQDLSNLASTENIERVGSILENADTASAGLSKALEDFSVVASAVADFADNISAFNVTLEGLTGRAESLFETAETTLRNVDGLVTESRTALSSGTATLDQATTTLASADRYITENLKQTTEEARASIAELRVQIDQIGTQAREMVAEFRLTGEAATARLTQVETTIRATDAMIADLTATLETFDKATTNFDALVMGDGTALVAEARAAIKPISDAANADLPALVADIRSAVETANRTITDVGQSLTDATGKVDGLMDDASAAVTTVTDTFSRANETLSAINSALVVGERTLTAAERTFDGADRVINNDVAAITTDLRRTIDTLDQAIAQVSADIPAVTADLKAASEAARQAFDEVARTASASGQPIRDFSANALPQFTRLSREMRDLIGNLDQLTRQIQRDPARFFLGGTNTPAYRQ
ncbi:MlaD family protein [Pseudotabrizicola sp.]|uniref:MlaD family protein n=1 Tax=Pseudotabrizicola sp. TaxID=2939647 RepID=UPI0027197EA3|nr:MlaD family protein [Pseudotabrizicola sp.]MDO8882081.1 MlaD family protein [Pseudotabrizicola sp.]MDP2081389.1 MlaD family protein [Pseudotabrizicola sp.]